MIEAQISYVAEALRLARGKAIEPKPEVQERFNTDIQRKLAKGIWTRGGCKSWYLDAKGVNRTIWPGFTWRYWLDTRKVRREDFLVG